MSKYTTTIEEYCISRYFAQLVEDNPDVDDPRVLWMQAMQEISQDPTIAYQIVADEIFPDPDDVPFYTDDSDTIIAFLVAWTDTFYFDEIGQETMQRFKITLRAYFRDNMPFFAELYASKLSDLTDLASNYKRTMDDDLTKLGTEQDEMSHGHKVEFEPTASQTNKIIPLGGSAETELNQSVAGGKDTTTNSGKDTSTLSFNNRQDKRHIVEEITGATGMDRALLVEKYRALIIDIDSMIFADMRKKHLFMEAW